MIRWPFGKPAGGKPAAGQRGGSRASRAGLTRKPDAAAPSFRLRVLVAAGLMAVGGGVLAWKAFTLQLVESDFLRGQGDERFTRVATVVAHRGSVTDRAGEPLAVSTPVDSVWVNPRELTLANDQIPNLARALERDPQELARFVTTRLDRRFLYVARHLQPADAAKVRALDIPGVHLTREYRRYYPAGEVTGHVIGFTDVDDAGQEGLELAYDHWLAGVNGAKRVIQDNLGRTVQTVESIRPMRAGRNMQLSIDMRIQYLAYRELKAAMQLHRARAGSVVVIDVGTGEVLAMVNQPTYNPNDRTQLKPSGYKNRAVTDLVEPGSTIKPFVVAAALASGKFTPKSIIDTNPGMVKVGIKMIEDKHNLGAIDLATALAKSSNVAMTRIALTLGPETLHDTLARVGFGRVTSSGYPGESAGLLTQYSHWRPITTATVSYGYGLSVTPLQLAHGYATLGAYGVQRPVSFARVDQPVPGERVLPEQVSRDVIGMLQTVVSDAGTGKRASIPGYSVAGKTGTAWKASAGGYSTNRYLAVFAGLAPASNPRLAAVVVIDEPSAGLYYGGDVSAPVFSAIVGGALRLLAVAPDSPLDPPVDEMPDTEPLPADLPQNIATAEAARRGALTGGLR
ncbi:MAG: penicillin-binding protein 2 [Gammaproteobacteria bacterium]|nr:penicillin-binding protein 2 [Gammaproteobacteria bacterium]